MWSTYWLACGCILWVVCITLCEQELGDISDELGDIDLGCRQGSYRHGDLCYTVWPGREQFADADITCKSGGGMLAMIKDLETQKFLTRLYLRKFSHNFWFGLTDKKVDGKWVFSDNTIISTFNKWDHDQPDNVGRSQHCAHMWMWRNLQWDDAVCNTKMRFICEYNAYKGGDQLQSYGNSFYELSKHSAIYDEAEKMCQYRGGRLATIKNEGTFNFLKKIIYAERFWLNMTDEQLQSIPHLDWSQSTWIGIQFLHGKWANIDGTPLNFQNWAHGNPNSDRSRACVKFTHNLWRNEKCNSYLPFICQYPGNAHCQSPPTKSGTGNFIIKGSFSLEVIQDNKKTHYNLTTAKVY